MRANIDPNQVTRFLLEKPAPYAELDENARIALSILHDDGWKTHRIGLDITLDVSITSTPIERPGTEEALAQSQAKFILLREEFRQQQRKPWQTAIFAFSLCGFLNLAGLDGWAFTFGALCVGGLV
jgi:hypothetical protein